MKKLFLLLWFSVTTLTAQENFTVDNDQISWQKVYETELSKQEIQEQLRQHPALSQIAENFSGTAKPTALNCEQSQAIYMRYPLQFFSNIEVKEGKYRVTVSRIEFIPEVSAEVFGIETNNNPEPWEDYAVKNSGEFRSNKMVQNSMNCIDLYLTELFKFNIQDTDW